MNPDLESLVREAIDYLTEVQKKRWNIVKICFKYKRVSFLTYPSFDLDAHPELEESICINLAANPPKIRSIRGGGKILHRKELFMDKDYPDYHEFLELTEKEEKIGLLDRNAFFKGKKLKNIMGQKQIWEEWLEFNKIKIVKHKLVSKIESERD